MAQHKVPDTIEFAGDYDLSHIFLHTHKGDVIDIKNLVQELNIYESIYNNALTGSLVIVDAQNLIAKLEINGTERISFKLATPGAKGKLNIVDASESTGHPFHVYKISDRKQTSPGSFLYQIHFASREFMMNMRTKISQKYNGKSSASAFLMFMKLDSHKTLTYEPSGNTQKVVIPNMRPFDAINLLASKTVPERTNGVGYYFYETTKGFHFRSWENMVVSEGRNRRPVKQEFYYMPLNITDPDVGDRIEHEYKSVESYKFENTFHDVAANTIGGTYGHRVITYNLFNKSYQTDDYNYHESFGVTKHSEEGADKFAVSDSNVDQTPKSRSGTSKVSDYPESRVSLQSTTQFLHDEDRGAIFGLNILEEGRKLGQSIAQRAQVVHGTALRLVVKGQSYLEAGDVIDFKLRSVDEKNPDGEQDPQYAGKYVITTIRHQINADKYTMVLECAKDSVRTGFTKSNFKIPRNTNTAAIRNTYQVESGRSAEQDYLRSVRKQDR